MDKVQLFNRVIEAAEKNADNLDDLLQVAIEQENEEEVQGLLNKVHQILTEQARGVYDLRFSPFRRGKI